MVFLKALAVFLGTVVGVGIFSLPYLASQSGFFVVAAYLLIMAVFVVFEHYIYAEITLGTEENYRFPGYVGKYLGSNLKNIAFFISFASLFGAILAYLIVGGGFLESLFSPYFSGGTITYTLLFFLAGAYFIFRDLKAISKIELLLVFFLFAVLAFFLLKTADIININNFFNFNPGFLFFPYGAVLFSLWGASSIPEIEEIFLAEKWDKKRTEKGVKKVILTSAILSVFIYLIFIIVVYGVSGSLTSKDAISGLGGVLEKNILVLGYIFGIICCFTSFISIGMTLKKIFWLDLNIPKNFSWFLACFLPLLLFLFGIREFIKIISVTGSLALGAEGIFAVFLYRKFLKEKFNKKINIFYSVLAFVLLVGILIEIYYFFNLS